jgi:hypothetical protein
MFAANRTEYDVKDIGRSVTVPNDSRAKLMYYLSCICSILDLDENSELQRFRRFQNYSSIYSREDKQRLLACCALLRPDLLEGKCIIHHEGLESSNEFIEVSKVNKTFAFTSNIIIGGQRKQVTKIMLYKMQWLRNNYLNPLSTLAEELEDSNPARSRRRDSDCSIS